MLARYFLAVCCLLAVSLSARADGGAFPGGPPKAGQIGSAASFPPASAAPFPVTALGGTSNFGATGVVGLSPSATIPAGNVAVVLALDGYQAGSGAITGTSVTDSKSNTWTLVTSEGSGFAGDNVQLWKSLITTPITTGDTITYHAATGFSGSVTLAISEAMTTCSSCAVDAAVTNQATNFSSAWTVSGAGSGAVSGEINFVGIVGNSAVTATSSGWTVLSAAIAGQAYMAAQVNPGTSPLTYAGTISSTAWAEAIMAIKP